MAKQKKKARKPNYSSPTPPSARPLRPDRPEDRVRAIFGLGSNNPLPELSEESHRPYYRYLSESLTFPFSASIVLGNAQQAVRTVRATVVDFLDFEDCNEEAGILCITQVEDESLVIPLAMLEGISGPNRGLTKDYSHWLWNGQAEAGSESRVGSGRPAGEADVAAFNVWTIYLSLCLGGAVYGATLGAALAGLDGAALAMRIGAILLALIGAVIGLAIAPAHAARVKLPGSFAVCCVIGLALGTAAGAMLGVMVLAITGAVLGGILGGLLGHLMRRYLSLGAIFLACIAGSMLGVIALAFLHSGAEAWTGTWIGFVVGAAGIPVLNFALSLALVFYEKKTQ